jgi:hypothetical protein
MRALLTPLPGVVSQRAPTQADKGDISTRRNDQPKLIPTSKQRARNLLIYGNISAE